MLVQGADWDRFRGPNGSGVAEAANLPAEFGPAKNVAWKAAIPFGRSSPVIAAGHLYLTATEGDMLVTLAYGAESGKQLWKREFKRTRKQPVFRANDPASPTPAADDNGVYVFFPDFGLVAYAADGKERWRHALGPFENFYGMSSSPVIANGMLLLLCDQSRGSYLIAIDKDTGKQRWKRDRAEVSEGWAVPIVFEDQILAYGTTRVDSYYLSTGEPRWWIPLSSFGSMGSPVVFRDSLIVTADGSDQPWLPAFGSVAEKVDANKDGKLSEPECKDEKDWFEHFGWVDSNHDKLIDEKEWEAARALGVGQYGAMSIPLNGKGRMDASAMRWRVKRNLPYVAAPLLYDGVLYMVKNGGIITSLDPATGKMFKQGRSEKALGEYYSSPIAAAGKVFLLSEEGKLTVLKASPQWEVLAVNDLGEQGFATPAISGNKLFVRTRGTLYAFAQR